ncbi:MAG: hypothetical protein ACLU3I_12215 [Acutalibacteraceae bacterium]
MLWISHQFETISQAEKYPLADGVASELINYINQELFSKISLATIGQRFFLSKSQINRIFRKATGSSVWEYILIKRLFAARDGFSPGVRLHCRSKLRLSGLFRVLSCICRPLSGLAIEDHTAKRPYRRHKRRRRVLTGQLRIKQAI